MSGAPERRHPRIATDDRLLSPASRWPACASGTCDRSQWAPADLHLRDRHALGLGPAQHDVNQSLSRSRNWPMVAPDTARQQRHANDVTPARGRDPDRPRSASAGERSPQSVFTSPSSDACASQRQPRRQSASGKTRYRAADAEDDRVATGGPNGVFKVRDHVRRGSCCQFLLQFGR